MKKIFLLALVLILNIGCNKDKGGNDNQFLPNYAFSVDINRTLPQYNNLQFDGSPVKINIEGAGILGLLVMKAGSNYVAFDGACPNHDLSACSTLTIDGVEAVCPCDGARYNLFTGLCSTGQPYNLKQYRTELNGNIIRIFN